MGDKNKSKYSVVVIHELSWPQVDDDEKKNKKIKSFHSAGLAGSNAIMQTIGHLEN